MKILLSRSTYRILPNNYVIFLTSISLLVTLKTSGQSLPDSIIILKKTYIAKGWNSTGVDDSLGKTKKYVFKKNVFNYDSDENTFDQSIISDLLKEINEADNRKNTLDRYGIDTLWIKNNPEKVLAMSSHTKRFSWNKQQQALIYPELLKIKNYEDGLNEILENGCCYTMHNFYRSQLIVKLYSNGEISNEIDSRKYVWGYRYPWIDSKSNKIFSLKIETLVDSLLNSPIKDTNPLLGRKLLRKLSDRIVEINSAKLDQLAAYTYEKEINELKSTFNIISFSQLSGYGGYWGDGPLIQLILKSSEMMPNVSVEFLASMKHGLLYSRDSIRKDYKTIVNKIQSIKFITTFLNNHPNSKLNILYFDNRPINQYNIAGANGKSAEWQNQDEYIESLKWFKTNNIKPSFDIVAAIKTSAHNYCGCDYRFSNEFIQKAIMFTINDKASNHSRWLLLPDNTVLLFLMSGEQVLNYQYSDFGDNRGIQYPCVRFDFNGTIIPKH